MPARPEPSPPFAPAAPAHRAINPSAPGSISVHAPHIPAQPTLPILSPADRPLLARLIALNEDFQALAAELATTDHALAAHLGAIAAARTAAAPAPAATSSLMPDAQCPMPSDLLSLYDWSMRPDIAAWLAFHRATKDHSLRQAALAALESIVKTSDNKPEQRRAATTLLRALDHRWPDPRWPEPRRHDPRRPGPLSPPSGGARWSSPLDEQAETPDRRLTPPSPRLPAETGPEPHENQAAPGEWPPAPAALEPRILDIESSLLPSLVPSAPSAPAAPSAPSPQSEISNPPSPLLSPISPDHPTPSHIAGTGAHNLSTLDTG